MTKFNINAILHNIRSAYNVGSIFRTSDGAGVSKLFLTGFTPYPPHNKIPKTALGAIDNVDWEQSKKINDVIMSEKNNGRKIIGVEVTKDAKLYTSNKYNLNDKITLIFGNEIDGVSHEILTQCDEIIYIPMHGIKESLNVATSFGIVVYEIIRQIKEL